MSNELKYLLPESRDKVIEIVKFFPEDWRYGCSLIAPREVYAQGRVAKHTLLTIQDHPHPLEFVQTEYFAKPFEDKQEPHHAYSAQLEDLIIGGKLPASIRVEGRGCNPDFERCVRKLLSHYLREGYKGNIHVGEHPWHESRHAQKIEIDHKKGTLSCDWKNQDNSQPDEIKKFLEDIKYLNLTETDVWTTVGR